MNQSEIKTAIVSEVPQVFNDKKLLKVFEDFINKLDKNPDTEPSVIEREPLKDIKYFQLLLTIENFKIFTKKLEEIKVYCSDTNLINGTNDSTLKMFLDKEKSDIYHRVDGSTEFKEFKRILPEILPEQNKTQCQCVIN